MLVMCSGNTIVLFIFHTCQQDADSLQSNEDDAVTEHSLSQVAAQEGDAIRAANATDYHSRRGDAPRMHQIPWWPSENTFLSLLIAQKHNQLTWKHTHTKQSFLHAARTGRGTPNRETLTWMESLNMQRESTQQRPECFLALPLGDIPVYPPTWY